MKSLQDLYGARAGAKTVEYPEGSVKDQTGTPLTGTPFKAEWQNDQQALLQRIMKEADLTANGNTDTVLASQLYDALVSVIGANSRALGHNWEAINVESNADSWRTGVYGNNKQLIASTSGPSRKHVAYSADGIAWTTVEIPALTGLTAGFQLNLGFDGTDFLIVISTDTNCYKSSDGITWTTHALVIDGGAGAFSPQDVKYLNGLYVLVAGGATSKLYTSADGITWTTRYTIANGPFGGVAYDPVSGNYIATRIGSADNAERIFTSPDATNWTARNSADDTYYWEDVAVLNGVAVAVSSNGANKRTMWSDDGGLTWTKDYSAGDSQTWLNVSAVGKYFIATSGATGAIMISRDGKSWATAYNALETVTNGSLGEVSGEGSNVAVVCSNAKVFVSGV